MTFNVVARSVEFFNPSGVLQVGTDEKYTTIQSAIDAWSGSETILVNPGTYNEGQLQMPAGSHIMGFGYSQTKIISSVEDQEIIYVASGCALEGLHVENSFGTGADTSRAIEVADNASNVTIDRCFVSSPRDCIAFQSAGWDDLTVRDCVFEYAFDGLLVKGNTTHIDRCVVNQTNNQTHLIAFVVASKGDIIITNCRIKVTATSSNPTSFAFVRMNNLAVNNVHMSDNVISLDANGFTVNTYGVDNNVFIGAVGNVSSVNDKYLILNGTDNKHIKDSQSSTAKYYVRGPNVWTSAINGGSTISALQTNA